MNEGEILSITFKNVNQGDCIILEWKGRDSQSQIGIIDCNGVRAAMPNIKKHLEKYQKVAFLVLSHPHKDHYSGIGELLQFCETQDIAIERIFDTFSFNPKNFHDNLPQEATRMLYESLAQSNHNLKSLEGVLKKFDEWHNQEKTIYRNIQTQGELLESMPSDLSFYLLSPSHTELKEYVDKTILKKDGNIKPTPWDIKKQANVLSTVFHLSGPQWQVILTSDAAILTFDRISQEPLDKPFDDRGLLALQVPHHGSVNSHQPTFWDSYVIKDKTASIISSGQNHNHKHPNYEVVEYFDKNTNKVYATNYVHGYAEFYPNKMKTTRFPYESDIDDQLAFIDADLNNHIETEAEDCGEQLIKIWADGQIRVQQL